MIRPSCPMQTPALLLRCSLQRGVMGSVPGRANPRALAAPIGKVEPLPGPARQEPWGEYTTALCSTLLGT